MKHLLFGALTIAALTMGIGNASAQGWGRPAPEDPTGLKDAYKDYFKVGVAINMRNLRNEEEMKLVKKEYNSITAENDHKVGQINPKEGVWNWGPADSIADFCRENKIPMRLHNLCWHSQFADWMMYDKTGKNFVKKEVFYKRLREYIHTVVNRYKDVIYAIDVVNEAMADGDGRPRWAGPGRGMETPSPYRQSNLYKLCGDEFIAKAFEYAAEAAGPDVELYYNDYNAADPAKRDRIYDMVKKMKEEYGVRVDGIGMQGHYNVYGPSAEDIDAAITKYATIVDHIQFTEVDIRANEEMGGQLQFSRQGMEIKPFVKTMHTAAYKSLFKVLRKHKDVINAVTFWNVSDKDSWVGTANYPLLFDKDLKKKEAYGAIKNFDPAMDNAEIKEDFVPASTNQPGCQYPMVNSQGYARFQIDAPQAKSVITSIGKNGGTVLHKNAEGLWVGTTDAPEDDGFHYYHLTIDGATVNDPGAMNYFGGLRWESGLEVPTNADRDFYAMKNVEHGNLQEVQFWSESTKQFRRAIVYTPASYGKNLDKKGNVVEKGVQKRYPVLYLQHGWGENETSWSVQGKANLIMDNLIAEGKCEEFIVVMTYGMTNDAQRGPGGPRGFDFTQFQTVLVDELVPYIDSHFNTIADKQHRAMTGLSMGGMETHAITLARPEVFGWYGLLSGGIYTPEEIKSADQTNLIFLSCGEKEGPDRIAKAVDDLKAAGYNAVAHCSKGTAHEFLTWRRGLYEIAQLLFKK